jgi:hypothetical protein
MVWGDGFEIETLLTCRFSLAGLKIAEVASTERERIHGETNLRTFADGTRVLRTLARECAPVVRRRPGRRAAVLATVVASPVAPLAPVTPLSVVPAPVVDEAVAVLDEAAAAEATVTSIGRPAPVSDERPFAA